MDKNLPAHSGDVGLIPGLGTSHMLRSTTKPVSHNYRPALQNLRAATTESHVLEPVPHNKSVAPALYNKRKTVCSNEDPAQPRNDRNNNKRINYPGSSNVNE